ncbi:hypothetical protein [Demequina sediminicola]|uniref:hypothetical protein n=1 Tax=Demequina sediminicola TaxID=1095026 RepID=UPI000783C377|nr:hypothetical protein [Demequina sediminicola]
MTEPTSHASDAVPADVKRDAIPATYRVAPRFGRIIGLGGVVGFVLGVVVSLVMPNTTETGLFMVAMLVGAGFALLGGALAGVIVALMDRDTPGRLKAAQSSAVDASEQGADLAAPESTETAPEHDNK